MGTQYVARESLSQLDSRLGLRLKNWNNDLSLLENFWETLVKGHEDSFRKKKLGRARIYITYLKLVNERIDYLKLGSPSDLNNFGIF